MDFLASDNCYTKPVVPLYTQTGYIYARISYLKHDQISRIIENVREKAIAKLSDNPKVASDIRNSIVEVNIPYRRGLENSRLKVCFLHVTGNGYLWNILVGKNWDGTPLPKGTTFVDIPAMKLSGERLQWAIQDLEEKKLKYPEDERLQAANESTVTYVVPIFDQCVVKDPEEGVSNCQLTWNDAPTWVKPSDVRPFFTKFNTDESVTEWQNPITKEIITTTYPIVWIEPQRERNRVHVLFSSKAGRRDALHCLEMRRKFNWKDNSTSYFLEKNNQEDEDEEEQYIDEDGEIGYRKVSYKSSREIPEAMFGLTNFRRKPNMFRNRGNSDSETVNNRTWRTPMKVNSAEAIPIKRETGKNIF